MPSYLNPMPLVSVIKPEQLPSESHLLIRNLSQKLQDTSQGSLNLPAPQTQNKSVAFCLLNESGCLQNLGHMPAAGL